MIRHATRLLLLLLSGSLCGSVALAATDMVWRELDPDNTVLIELTQGRVVVELNPIFAPQTVAQFKRLVLSRFYDGLSFYRVIDGFVAQGGDGSDLGELSNVPLIDAEYSIDWPDDLPYTPVQSPDFFAPQTGFVNGFAVARDPAKGEAWLTHCPGTIAMARNEDAHSSRTDFYIVIGQAPRYLDRNMNVFGRVVLGMEWVQSISRGPADQNGIIQSDLARSRIRSVRLLGEFPKDERWHVLTMDTHSKAFRQLLDDRRERRQKFFINKPPPLLDICQIPLSGQMTK